MKTQSYSNFSWLRPWGQSNQFAFGLKEFIKIKNVNMVRKMLAIENWRNMINMPLQPMDIGIRGEMEERGWVNILLTVFA